MDIDEDDGHLFEDHQPDPRQKPVMDKVYDKMAKDLLMRVCTLPLTTICSINEAFPRSSNIIQRSGLDGKKSKDIRSSRITSTGGVSLHVTTVVSVEHHRDPVHILNVPASMLSCL